MTINCKGKLMDLSSPKVMGILNLTPDSFFDGGKFLDEKACLQQVEKMLLDGADFIDLGACSSRPNAELISETEELNRLLPILEQLVLHFPEALFSVDTFRSRVAEESVHRGVALINDISAGFLDENMLPTIGKLKIPYCMMHMKGTPETMKDLTQYQDLLKEVLFYFSERINLARQYGINDIIVDPGFGFAKNITQNFELLRSLEALKIMDLPILIGISRKSMIYKTLQTTPEYALNGTTALHMVALQNGANILRVHDVKEAVECVKLFELIK
mgnify:CR=1 FL=1